MKIKFRNLLMIVSLLLASVSSFVIPAQNPEQLYRSLEEELLKDLHSAHDHNDIPSTLLLLKVIADDAVRKGTKAPDYNLCDFKIEHTNLFCVDNKGIARIDMPQLSGFPIPGSQADALPRDKRGQVNATNHFSDYLKNTKKYKITRTRMPVTRLKATQNELIGSKVAGIWSAMQDPTSPTYKDIMESGIFVSQEGFVLDGHHRWAAAVSHAISNGTLFTTSMVVNRIEAPIDDLVRDANIFAKEFGIRTESGLER